MPASINPLTGLPASDAQLLERRPLAVKINLVPRTYYRPPWGLSLADIVYDFYHNDGYSRLHAIFYGNDAELVGPIRSGRFLDGDLVRMYKSAFAYGSADQNINNRLLNADYANRLLLEGQIVNCPPSTATPLCRYDRSGYDFLLTGTAAMSQYLDSKSINNTRQNLEGMTFFSIQPEGGSPGGQVFVRYSGDNYMRWDYDPTSGRYLRFQDNVFDTGQGEEFAPLTDRLNEQQIAAENVVVVLVRHEYYQQPPNEIVDILLSGTGTAYAFRDGQVYQVTWNRPTLDSVLYLTLADGSAYTFKPGSTWFQVVGATTQVTQPSAEAWRFNFSLP
jgi:hypothetical protein